MENTPFFNRIIQHNQHDASVKLIGSYIAELNQGADQLERYDNHIAARTSYERLLQVAAKAKSHISNVPAEIQTPIRFEIEEATIHLEIAFIDLHRRFNLLDDVYEEQVRRAAEIGKRLVDLIEQYARSLNIVWPSGCLLLGNVHGFLGNDQHQAAAYAMGLDAIRSSTSPEEFSSIEISLLRHLDDKGYSVSNAPRMQIQSLNPFIKVYENTPKKILGIKWIIGGVLFTMCWGVGLIGVAIGGYMIYDATSNGTRSYGKSKFQLIRSDA